MILGVFSLPTSRDSDKCLTEGKGTARSAVGCSFSRSRAVSALSGVQGVLGPVCTSTGYWDQSVPVQGTGTSLYHCRGYRDQPAPGSTSPAAQGTGTSTFQPSSVLRFPAVPLGLNLLNAENGTAIAVLSLCPAGPEPFPGVC